METLFFQHAAGAWVHCAQFSTGSERTHEAHLSIEAPSEAPFVQQLSAVVEAYQDALQRLRLREDSGIFRRVFLSDSATQEELVRASRLADSNDPVALSIIEQPPAFARKIGLWAYHAQGARPRDQKKTATPHGVFVERNGLGHLWTAGLTSAESASAHAQTTGTLELYCQELQRVGGHLADDALRTWFFVNDIDTEYQGLVEARRVLFRREGLTPETHFIASTGIAGRVRDPAARVVLDACSTVGLSRDQVSYLAAPKFLGPAHAYGVTFERGTKVTYSDRSHLVVSGTASIDPTGTTLHVGDVERQLVRALENIEALLHSGQASVSDIAHVLVYLRDGADAATVTQLLDRRWPKRPRLIVRAPVCRPNWLVEVECMAITPASHGSSASCPEAREY